MDCLSSRKACLYEYACDSPPGTVSTTSRHAIFIMPCGRGLARAGSVLRLAPETLALGYPWDVQVQVRLWAHRTGVKWMQRQDPTCTCAGGVG